ncbi:MAG: hypothetical protein KDI47_04390 [Gammaproteobacteria bacterium]|nr:hypothetical protein [Gammaproteobacteria bacterium]MCB1871887.1 hypothetical protein [Gammaproteobacteria bacterium]MCB1904581.1 hypothetical protein [Gammaproteobacteria bacterium]
MINELKHEVERILSCARKILKSSGTATEAGRAALQIERSATKLLGRDAQCICPECGYRFRGNGWDGIDAHWRAKHESVMTYSKAWPLIKAGVYRPSQRSPLDDLFTEE